MAASVEAMSVRPAAPAAAMPAATAWACWEVTVTCKPVVTVWGAVELPNDAVMVAFSVVPTAMEGSGVRVRVCVRIWPGFSVTGEVIPVSVRPVSVAAVSLAMVGLFPAPVMLRVACTGVPGVVEEREG